MSFTNQVAVITGASSGIGRELAKLLAAEGCKVGLIARREDRLKAMCEEIGAAGGTAASAIADVADRAQVQAAFQDIASRLGPVDLLIANAGLGLPTLLEPINITDVENMIRVNLLGVIYAIEAVLPDMLRRDSGHLVAISSLASYKGLPSESGYCASKAGVNAYMEGLRIQLCRRGVAVTTVCPGFVLTEMTETYTFDMPWIMNADKAARKILKALRRRPKVYNFPWQTSLLMRATRWVPDWIVERALRGYKKPYP